MLQSGCLAAAASEEPFRGHLLGSCLCSSTFMTAFFFSVTRRGKVAIVQQVVDFWHSLSFPK